MDAEELDILRDEETVIAYLADCLASGSSSSALLEILTEIAPYHNIPELLKKIIK